VLLFYVWTDVCRRYCPDGCRAVLALWPWGLLQRGQAACRYALHEIDFNFRYYLQRLIQADFNHTRSRSGSSSTRRLTALPAQVYQLDGPELTLLKEVEKPDAFKCATFGASSATPLPPKKTLRLYHAHSMVSIWKSCLSQRSDVFTHSGLCSSPGDHIVPWVSVNHTPHAVLHLSS
jgi:hypothetical protein